MFEVWPILVKGIRHRFACLGVSKASDDKCKIPKTIGVIVDVWMTLETATQTKHLVMLGFKRIGGQTHNSQTSIGVFKCVGSF